MKRSDIHTDENGLTYCDSKTFCSECDNPDCIFSGQVKVHNKGYKAYEWTDRKYEQELSAVIDEEVDDAEESK